ncbi:MAG TPA: hypothetical protein VK899_03905 [Gemmatimonadales bacterium]|nr:hypothetical protein [Gemmatimonadales bacterium]
MKKVYQASVDRFISQEGGKYRFFNRRWWILTNEHWTLGHRMDLERELTGIMAAFAPPAVLANLNQSDLNQICAFLSRRLYTDALPGRWLDVSDDPRLLNPDARPRMLLSDQ